MSTATLTPICPCCQKETDCYEQPATRGCPEHWDEEGEYYPARPAHPPMTMGTCKTPDCDYQDVTLSAERWVQLATDTAMQADYRGMYTQVLNW